MPDFEFDVAEALERPFHQPAIEAGPRSAPRERNTKHDSEANPPLRCIDGGLRA